MIETKYGSYKLHYIFQKIFGLIPKSTGRLSLHATRKELIFYIKCKLLKEGILKER